MDKKKLIVELDLLGINPSKYSLKGDLNPDTIVLFHNYKVWEVFYLDEKGGRNNKREFDSEDEACLYIYKLFKDSKEIDNKFGVNN